MDFPGEGFGTKWLIDRGVTADYALVGETSGFGIVQAECGAAWFKIRIYGRELYTRRLERGSSLKEHPNAFVKVAHAVLALEQWAIDYEKRERYEFSGGTIIPKAQVVHVRAPNDIGHPSAFCDIYLVARNKVVNTNKRNLFLTGFCSRWQPMRGNAFPMVREATVLLLH